jgi:hypothetical protein
MTKRHGDSRINIIGQNGNEGSHYAQVASAYINRQTARKLIEGVARQLTHEAERTNNSVEHQQREAQVQMLRDALALLVGDGGYPFEADAGTVE